MYKIPHLTTKKKKLLLFDPTEAILTAKIVEIFSVLYNKQTFDSNYCIFFILMQGMRRSEAPTLRPQRLQRTTLTARRLTLKTEKNKPGQVCRWKKLPQVSIHYPKLAKPLKGHTKCPTRTYKMTKTKYEQPERDWRIKMSCIHPSIVFRLSLSGLRGGWSLSQLP